MTNLGQFFKESAESLERLTKPQKSVFDALRDKEVENDLLDYRDGNLTTKMMLDKYNIERK